MMSLLTVTITPYEVNAVPTVLHWRPKNFLHLCWMGIKLAYVIVVVYGTGRICRDTEDSDKGYVLDKNGDILFSISIEETPASYDHQLALSV